MSVPVTVKVLPLSSLAELVIVIRALWFTIVFRTPTLTLALLSVTEGITDVTVPNTLVVCWVWFCALNAGTVS